MLFVAGRRLAVESANTAIRTRRDWSLEPWIRLATGMGVEAARAETLEEFADLLAASCRRKGPFLIQLVIP
jgi:thiamine pyrophosphate-dependent acetolactate synthase large subunit-like protein